MNLSIAIPFAGQEEMTERCIDTIHEHTAAVPFPEIILINNGTEGFVFDYVPPIKYIENKENKGVLPALQQALDIVDSEIIVFMHNDVLIHEHHWDKRLIEYFQADPKLALVGLFGAPGVDFNGARIGPHSNMLGAECGQPGSMHGGSLSGLHPASVVDSLFMAFRTDVIKTLDLSELPPHHWFDRVIPLMLIERGYHVATAGIGFDHCGGVTSSSPVFSEFTKKWCLENGLVAPVDDSYNWDLLMYNKGLEVFNRWLPRLPLKVDARYNYRWNR